MPFYTLKPGQACGHCGRDLKPGEVIELPERIGNEITDKLMLVDDPAGMPVVPPPPSAPFVRVAPAPAVAPVADEDE